MVKKKRQCGTGSIVREKQGLAIRWPEYVVLETGERKRKMRYEFVGPVSEREANHRLMERLARARRDPPKSVKSSVTFNEHVVRWQRAILESAGEDAADLYKYSVRDVWTGIIESRLKPRFGVLALSAISTALIQEWVGELRREGLAASTIHTYVKPLRIILERAMTWKELVGNPAKGVELPKLKGGNRRKGVLTAKQAGELIGKIVAARPRAMVTLAITAGLRRGELLAARWKHLDEEASEIAVVEASYRGHIDTPKTEAGFRTVPLDSWALGLLHDWQRLSTHTHPDDFIFATRMGNQESPGNILRRYVFPACAALNLPRATWNTFRRTFSTMLHKEAVPARTIAEMMGHANVNTQFIYIQSQDEMKRVAAGKIGEELSRYLVQTSRESAALVN